MRAKITKEQLFSCLDELNTQYESNIKLKRCEYKGKYLHFTLRPVNSSKRGAKYNIQSDRRVYACCWHVHGDLFDIILRKCPDVVIHSRGTQISTQEDNWQDFNVGTIMNPMYASEACRC